MYVALGFQHTKRMRRTTVYSPLCLVWTYNIFPPYLINDIIFRTKLLNIQRVFWFSIQRLSEAFLILRRIQWDVITNVNSLPLSNRFSHPIFIYTWKFSTDFLKLIKYQILWKSIQWEPKCCMRTDRQVWRRWHSLFAILSTHQNIAF